MPVSVKLALLRFVNFYLFSGKSGRAEFWLFILFFYAFNYALFGLAMHFSDGTPLFDQTSALGDIILTFYAIWMLVAIYSSIIRRLRDADYSAAWVLIKFVPIIGAIILLGLLCIPTKSSSEADGVNA